MRVPQLRCPKWTYIFPPNLRPHPGVVCQSQLPHLGRGHYPLLNCAQWLGPRTLRWIWGSKMLKKCASIELNSKLNDPYNSELFLRIVKNDLVSFFVTSTGRIQWIAMNLQSIWAKLGAFLILIFYTLWSFLILIFIFCIYVFCIFFLITFLAARLLPSCMHSHYVPTSW